MSANSKLFQKLEPDYQQTPNNTPVSTNLSKTGIIFVTVNKLDILDRFSDCYNKLDTCYLL